jgi:hypothetical protein
MIYDAVEGICEVPLAAPPWSYNPQFRAWTLKRLPYRVIYEVTDQLIRIVTRPHQVEGSRRSRQPRLLRLALRVRRHGWLPAFDATGPAA